jgi:hypothetical protein
MALPLGKRQAKEDPSVARFGSTPSTADLLFPKAFDFDAEHAKLKNYQDELFLNDRLPCCVISGRAHQTVRFEYLQRPSKKLIDVADAEVKHQYQHEAGPFQGLVVSESLREWKNAGWMAAGRRLHIEEYLRLNEKNLDEIRAAIFNMHGIGIGFQLTHGAEQQFQQGVRVWGDTTEPKPRRRGHYVFVNAYDEEGPTCITWGQKVKMTWGFFKRYCDEAYVMLDELENWEDTLDIAAVREHIEEVRNG